MNHTQLIVFCFPSRFMYNGKVNVAKSRLDSFRSAARHFELFVADWCNFQNLI